MTRARPIHWKSKIIERWCHSSKDDETLILNKMVEDAVFIVRQIETLLYGSYGKRLPVHLYTDSEGTLESIASTRQVDRKSLRMFIQDLKERLLEGEFTLCQWILTGSMWAYALTKKIEMHIRCRNCWLRVVYG